MKRSLNIILALVVTFVFLCPITQAQDENDIEYDIFRKNGNLIVWLDFSFILSQSNWKKLQDGIDLALEYQLSLATPRRLLGSRLVIQTNDALKISYRQITEDYFLTCLIDNNIPEHRFISSELLTKYLKDSIYIRLASMDSLDIHKRYTLEINLTSISLTAINLLGDGNSSDSSRTALKSLFEKFLNLTGYGRKEFSIKSRSFSLLELFQEP